MRASAHHPDPARRTVSTAKPTFNQATTDHHLGWATPNKPAQDRPPPTCFQAGALSPPPAWALSTSPTAPTPPGALHCGPDQPPPSFTVTPPSLRRLSTLRKGSPLPAIALGPAHPSSWPLTLPAPFAYKDTRFQAFSALLLLATSSCFLSDPRPIAH